MLELPGADHLDSTLVTGLSLAAIEGPAIGVATPVSGPTA